MSRERMEVMDMMEVTRLLLGLRAAGWTDKEINDFVLLYRDRRRSVYA